MDYIRNSKNRKLKTQILSFFSRISFGTHRLGFAGKGIFSCMVLLLLSLFFPWMTLSGTIDTTPIRYSAFSLYTWGIGYGIVLAVALMAFFLFSHAKKETLRAYVPFRLSDAQAIVFLAAMIITATLHFTVISLAYADIAANTVTAGFWLKIALSSSVLLLVAAFFFSQNEKARAVTMSYLAKNQDSSLSWYEDILSPNQNGKKDEKNNMTLPI